jgi:hypothetical protein
MKKTLFAFLLVTGCFLRSSAQTQETPEQLVQRQLDAYNARNIDAFMDTYSDSVELYTFPATLSLKGKEQMRKGYQAFFELNAKLHCEIRKRIVQGNTIIDQEYVTGLTSGAVIEATAIYIVEAGKISKVYFIR